MIRNKKRQDLTNTAQIIFAHIRESNSTEYNIYSIRNENVIHSLTSIQFIIIVVLMNNYNAQNLL